MLVVFALLVSKAHGECSLSSPSTVNSYNEGPFYLANTPKRNRLAPENQLVDPADVFVVEGQIFGSDCNPIANAQIEVWYAGYPDRYGNYYSIAGSALNYRGTLQTDACGRYQITQIFPIQFLGSPHNHFRVTLEGYATPLVVTEMYIAETMVPSFRPDASQVVHVENLPDGSRRATFDIKVNIAGTADTMLCGMSLAVFVWTKFFCSIVDI